MSEQADVPKNVPPLDELLACPECDLLMHKPTGLTQKVSCPRCGYVLSDYKQQMVTRSLALVLAALLLYVPANFLPIMQLNLFGRVTQDTVWSGVVGLYEGGMKSVAAVVFLCSMAIPLLKLVLQLLVLLSIQLRVARSLGTLFYRWYHHLREWGMLEVYLIGILVSVVKLMDMADLSVGAGLGCFIVLLWVQVWLEFTMVPHQVWLGLTEEGPDASH